MKDYYRGYHVPQEADGTFSVQLYKQAYKRGFPTREAAESFVDKIIVV